MIMRIKEAAAIEFCNNERTHMSINMMTPSETAQYTGEIKKAWTSYRLIAIKSKLTAWNLRKMVYLYDGNCSVVP